jgi:ketosteroid isomerase-like protein
MNPPSIPRLPAVVQHYFGASNRRDVAATVECFTGDATVNDQFGSHLGRASIQRWIEETTRKYAPTLLPLKATATAADLAVIVSVSGDFPGSPVQLNFHFRFRRRQIAALAIE